MKTLLLVRHAKSDWSDPALDDHDRPLAPRGIRATGLIGSALAPRTAPGVIMSSTANRAFDTANRIAAYWNPAPPVVESRELYLASPGQMLAVLGTFGGAHETVMLVAHEPGIRHLALVLDGSTDPPFTVRYPTGAVAVLRFEADRWSALEPGSGVRVDWILPRALERAASRPDA